MTNSTPLPLNSIVSLNFSTQTQTIRASGILLSTGQHILTAAHLFNEYDDSKTILIKSADDVTYQKENLYIYHGWDSTDQDYNHDLAIIELSPQETSIGLSLWQNEHYMDTLFTLTGFGNNSTLHTGNNIFEGDASLFNPIFNKSIIEGTQLLYDYDNGLEAQNSIQNLFNTPSSISPVTNETLSQFGDSGGALLVNNQIAAISSYIFRDPRYDINDIVDSSAGEIGIATRIFPYIPWINFITTGNIQYTAPEKAEDVLTSVPEPFAGEIVNFFLLEVPKSSEDITLHYTTRDGTAISGSDYQQTQGLVTVLANETSKAIAVTIYGDIEPENDETFSLIITDPTGYWFDSTIELIATHTIINNDIF